MLKQQSERKERAPERIGVELCDLQGLQQSLASIEMTLCAVLAGIGEDLAKKCATACVRLSSEVERAMNVVTALQVGMVTERLRGLLEHLRIVGR